MRVRVFEPFPHVLSHLVNRPHGPMTQLTGHGFTMQSLKLASR
jgi:hypothetical protein